MEQVRVAREHWARIRASYERGDDEAGDGRPLLGYVVLLTIYSVLTGTSIALVRRRGLPAERPSAADLALVTVSTFRVSRTLTKGSVTAPFRAPFATYQGPAGPGEVMEAPRPGPVRHAVGELVTCPFCASQWVATAHLTGLALFPRVVRWLSAGMTVVAAAEALQHGYAALQEATE